MFLVLYSSYQKGDNYDDFLIGAYGNSDGGACCAGQTYLIMNIADMDVQGNGI